MGNSESNCYSKDEKYKTKQKLSKHKASSSNSLQMRKNCPTTALDSSDVLKCNDKSIAESASSSDEAYTPVSKKKECKASLVNPDQWDPRSPSEGIVRTPIQFNQETVAVLNDPRSPSCGIDRTPIVQPDFDSKSKCSFTQKLLDPRSPTAEIDRTPLNLACGPGNSDLRRAVLLTNTLKTSPLTKKISYSLDATSDDALVTCFENNIDDSFYSAKTDFVLNDAIVPNENAAVNLSGTNVSVDVSEILDEIVSQVCVAVVSIDLDVQDHESSHSISQEDKEQEAEVTDTSLRIKCQKSSDSKILNFPEIIDDSVQGDTATCSHETEDAKDVGVLATENSCKKDSETPAETVHLERKSSIPSLKLTERKRPVKEKPQTFTRSKNGIPRKKDVSLRNFDSQTSRSPLSVLGHTNSPEPKRMRQNNESDRDGYAASTKENKKVTRSRLPRYSSKRSHDT